MRLDTQIQLGQHNVTELIDAIQIQVWIIFQEGGRLDQNVKIQTHLLKYYAWMLDLYGHASAGERNPWWEVDVPCRLGRHSRIQSICSSSMLLLLLFETNNGRRRILFLLLLSGSNDVIIIVMIIGVPFLATYNFHFHPICHLHSHRALRIDIIIVFEADDEADFPSK